MHVTRRGAVRTFVRSLLTKMATFPGDALGGRPGAHLQNQASGSHQAASGFRSGLLLASFQVRVNQLLSQQCVPPAGCIVQIERPSPGMW